MQPSLVQRILNNWSFRTCFGICISFGVQTLNQVQGDSYLLFNILAGVGRNLRLLTEFLRNSRIYLQSYNQAEQVLRAAFEPAEGVAQDGNAGWSEGKTFPSCIIYFPVLRNCWVKTWAGIALSISIVPTLIVVEWPVVRSLSVVLIGTS